LIDSQLFLLPSPTAVAQVEFSPAFVCLFSLMISQKPMQLGQPNLASKRSTMNPGNPLILGSKGQSSRSSRGTENSPGVCLCFLCECWIFL